MMSNELREIVDRVIATHVADHNIAYWAVADPVEGVRFEDGHGNPACAVCEDRRWPCDVVTMARHIAISEGWS